MVLFLILLVFCFVLVVKIESFFGLKSVVSSVSLLKLDDLLFAIESTPSFTVFVADFFKFLVFIFFFRLVFLFIETFFYLNLHFYSKN